MELKHVHLLHVFVCLWASVCLCLYVQYISINVGLSLLVVLITPKSTIDLFRLMGVFTMSSLCAGAQWSLGVCGK